jgi:hypothetical protein
MTTGQEPSDYQARIRDRAYVIWEREGRPDESPSELRQRAERMIAAEEHTRQEKAPPERGLSFLDIRKPDHRGPTLNRG